MISAIPAVPRCPHRAPRLIAILAAGCMLLALGACGKGGDNNEGKKASGGIPTYQVSVTNFTYQGMPDTVPANQPFNIVFSNKETFDITHELVLLGVPAGKTADDVIASAKAKGPDGEGDYLGFGEIADVDTGGAGVGSFNLPPGNYVISCWEDGKAGGGTGPVHASIGMVKAFTVS
jgi:hypothetical protein